MDLAASYLAGGNISINNPIWMVRSGFDETAFIVDDGENNNY